MKKLWFLIILVSFSCNEEKIYDPLAEILQSELPAIKKIVKNTKKYEVQIIYTQIDKGVDGKIKFKDYTFHLNNHNYFYPASTVKLPVAVLALEFIDAFEGLSPLSNYTVEGDSSHYIVASDVRQIFSVSDNDAFNRLYELLGRDAINNSLRSKGLEPVRISHRLSTEKANTAQRKPLDFAFGLTLGGKMDKPIQKISLERMKKGIGFIRNDSLISKPMDFTEKNYFPLETQHNLMKRIFFEDSFSETERFNLSTSSKELLKKAMYTVPRKEGYDEGEFYDSYGKFFIYGTSRGRIQDHIKIYNKVGYAYGTLTETALITDEKKDVQFLLSATILVNENGIYNDDVYEYEAMGLPFLAELGRALYQFELKRIK